MAAITKFIIQIMCLLAAFSFVGVSGSLVITDLSSDPVPGCLGWIFLCSVAYLFCVDLLTLQGVSHG